jgi:Arc/MetJ-type ribon-helix-helix transcriptional regulator
MNMPMKIVTINIPDQYLDCIEVMIQMGFFPSRSEAVREALKQFLVNEVDINHALTSEGFQQLKRQQLEEILG